MATILEFVRGLLNDGDEQERFAADPHAYVDAHAFAGLAGEDIVEAVRVVARSLPQATAERLSPYEADDERLLPPVRPQFGEDERDAAVRQLQHAISLVSASAEPPIRGVRIGVTSEPAAAPDAVAASEPAATPWAAAAPEPRAVESVVAPREFTAPAPAARPATSAPVDAYAGLGEEIAAIVRHAGEQMQQAALRAEEQAHELVARAEREANDIRARAEADAESVRAGAYEEAESIRAAAHADALVVRETATREADSILQTARATHDDAQHHATEVVERAQHEADDLLAEASARRDEVRETERELRERLQGLETLFRRLEGSSATQEEH